MMRTDPNIQDPDTFYLHFVQAHEGLSEQSSFELNARLVFLLANQIGDPQVLAQCIEAAKLPEPQAESVAAADAASAPADAG